MNNLIQRFDALLAPYAVHNAGDHGRVYRETELPDKLAFQRDRDRIIHSKAFRRLKHKTQVWVAGKNDHFRDRLTHSLEGSQIARSLARNLQLNEDLAEAGILAHDLGHPPFGHEGEHALHEMLEPLGFHFDHNQHSLRIVTVLENNYPDFPGLNLTKETLNCLRKHETPWELPDAPLPHGSSLEAQIVNLADEISYYAHDVDDGLRSELISLEDFFKLQIGQRVAELLKHRYPNLKPGDRAFRPQLVRSLIHLLITDIVETTKTNIRDQRIHRVEDVYGLTKPVAIYGTAMEEATDELRQYLYANFYLSEPVKAYTIEGRNLIQELFTRYYENPKLMPAQIQAQIDEPEPLPIVIKDYIAGMTDTFLKDTVAKTRNRLI